MSKRIEQSRRHGHWDPRYPAEPAVREGARISVVTPRNAQQGGPERSSPAEANAASRYELWDADGLYTGTFVTRGEAWQVGDVFTTGDGRWLRITAITAAESSPNQPAYTNRWNVEAV